jgi:hypothetical protein
MLYRRRLHTLYGGISIIQVVVTCRPNRFISNESIQRRTRYDIRIENILAEQQNAYSLQMIFISSIQFEDVVKFTQCTTPELKKRTKKCRD